jgi:hypothetical protein
MKTTKTPTASTLGAACLLMLASIGSHPIFAQTFIQGNALLSRTYATDNDPTNAQVVIDFTITHPGTLQNVLTWGQNFGGALSGIGQSFDTYVLRPLNATNYLVVTNTGYFIVTNVGLNTFPAPSVYLQVGDVLAHYGRGIPLATGTGGPSSVYDNNGLSLPKPIVGQTIALPGPIYPLYNDGGRDYAIAITVSGVPNLTITPSGTNVILAWPAAGNTTLMQTTNLTSGIWTTNATFTATTGINRSTNAASSGNRFFRLRSP